MGFWYHARRWWREFWSGRQNGLEAYNLAYEDCRTKTDLEIIASMKNADPASDLFDIGWIKGCTNFLLYERGWHRDEISERMGW